MKNKEKINSSELRQQLHNNAHYSNGPHTVDCSSTVVDAVEALSNSLWLAMANHHQRISRLLFLFEKILAVTKD